MWKSSVAILWCCFMACGRSASPVAPALPQPVNALPLTSIGDHAPVETTSSPFEADGLALKIRPLKLSVTLTPRGWKVQLFAKKDEGGAATREDDEMIVVFRLEEVPIQLSVLSIRTDHFTGLELAEQQERELTGRGFTLVAPMALGQNGRYTLSASGTNAQGLKLWIDVEVLSHPAMQSAYLVCIAAYLQGERDAFLSDVRAIQDSFAPIP